MCSCQDKIIDNLKAKYPNATSITGQYELLSGRSYSVVKIHTPDKKKPKEALLLDSYCPHCGLKYSDNQETGYVS